VGLFRRPVPRGSRAAWAGGPQALSPAAAMTYRVSVAAGMARRGSPKVRLNETFTAKFQHLYTSPTWRFLGWSRAREKLSLLCLRPSSFVGMVVDLGERCSRIWRGSRVASPGRWSPRRAGWSGTPTHLGAVGAAHLYPLLDQQCAMSSGLNQGQKPGVGGCLSKRPTYDQFSFSKSAMKLALVMFAVETMSSFLAKVHGQSDIHNGQSFARNSRFQRIPRRQCKDRLWLTNADWMIGGGPTRPSGRADHRAEDVPALPAGPTGSRPSTCRCSD
jgi:hypothetical protein